MFLTKEILEKYNACGMGLKWFQRHYPNGGELIDVIQNPKIDRHTLHWGYANLPTTDEEKKVYRRLLNIDQNEQVETIYHSDNVVNSMFITRSSGVEDSTFVFHSEEVLNSNSITGCKNIQRSNAVYDSEFVYDSEKIFNCHNVNNSHKIINSDYVINSNNVINAASVIDSAYVIDLLQNHTKQITSSYFISNCSNMKHCMFCFSRIDGEYLVFNKPVSEMEYVMIKSQLESILKNQDLKFVKDGWPLATIPLDRPIIDRNISHYFSNLPEAFWRWVKTLPGYDPMLMYNITMQNNLIKNK
jgi:hypothetical protein